MHDRRSVLGTPVLQGHVSLHTSLPRVLSVVHTNCLVLKLGCGWNRTSSVSLLGQSEVLSLVVPLAKVPARLFTEEALSQTTGKIGKMRYTPVTCDPDDFVRSGYKLRDYGGDIELFIAMTTCYENEFRKMLLSYVSKPHRCLNRS